MKRTVMISALVLAAALLCPLLCSSLYVSAAGTSGNMAEIIGIDYDRITQKTYGGKKSYPVELKLGSLTFSGELYGDYGLTYKELNDIIYRTLEEKNLTVERVVTVKNIAARAQTDAALYWGDQVLEGLLSYLTIPFIPVSAGDYYSYKVHGEIEPGVKSAVFSASKASAKEAVRRAANLAGKVGRVGRVASTTAGLPGLGQIVNTAMVGSSWREGSNRFENYQKLLEDNLALINDFYSTCSQRAAKLVEDKDVQNKWKIKFDKNRNYRTYNCTFWGISGNLMSCTLSGELSSADNSMTGAYTGTLWLEFAAEDFSPVETNIEKTTGLKSVIGLIYSTGGYKKTADTGGRTTLKCESQGQLTFYIEKTEGTVKPNVVGTLSGDKETEFSFDRHLEWRDETYASLGAHGFTEADVTSGSIDSVNMKTSSIAYGDKGGGESTKTDNDYRQDPGTVLAPLEKDPVIIIYFS
ncbi:MAG: hypothetical protein IJK33_08305 [Clostridia bacterium]|nr:hypothetical protein [Clostridia bacterium]